MVELKWSEKLIDKWKDGDIPNQLDELQHVYRRSILVCIGMTAGGIALMCSTAYLRIIALGLLLAISGILSIVLMKIWVHIKHSMFRVIWELQQQRKNHLD